MRRLICLPLLAATAVALVPAAAPPAPPAGLLPDKDEELIRLAPLNVTDEADRQPWAALGGPYRAQEAVGNLDLPRTQMDALPFTIFEREQLFRSGAVDLEEFLRREMLDGAAGGPAGAKGGGVGFTSLVAGGNSLKLRGYAADETVILVNGRRLPEIVSSGANAQPQSADVSFIPLSLVERIEVLPVSASALYAGNPVGGVINIVLRPDVNVTELTAHTTNALSGFDAAQSTVSLLHGQSLRGGALRLRLNASVSETTPPTESELGHVSRALATQPVSAGRLYRATPNVRSLDGSPLFGAGTASFTSVAPGADGGDGLAAFGGRQGVRSLDLFTPAGGLVNSPVSGSYAYGLKQRNESAFASVTYDVTRWLQLGVDGMYSRTTFSRGFDVLTGDLRLRSDSPQNPFGRTVEVSLNEIAPLLGGDYSRAQRTFSSLVLGAMLTLPADWRVSVDTQRGRNLTRYRGLAGVSASRWQQLVDRGQYQPLRDTQVSGPPPEFYEQALIYTGGRGRVVSVGDYGTLDTALRVTNRALRLPTGTSAVNFGGDFRLTELRSYTDEQRYGDGTLAAAPVHWTGRTLQRVSVFGEIQAPLVPARRLPRWLREIEADLAARYTIADTTQESNLAPTGGLKIGLPGGLALRGSVATTNRLPTPIMNTKVAAPALRVSSVGGVNTISVFDPLRGEKYGIRAMDAINPNLRPEAAVTRAVGVMFARGDEHRLRISVDFVDTQKSGELMYLDPQNVLNLESVFPERVNRAAPLAGDAHRVGLVTSVLKGNFNLAWRHSQNVNTSIDYAWRKCLGGTLEAYARWISFQRYDRQLLPHSPTVDQLHAPDGADPGLLKDRVNFGGGWIRRSYAVRLDGHFYSARALPAAEWPSQGAQEIEPYWQFDASVQKDLGRWLPWKNDRRAVQVQLRVNNLFGAAPPRYVNDASGAGVQSYTDWRRQTYALSLRATF